MNEENTPFGIRDFGFPRSGGMLSEDRIEDLHRAVDRVAQKQAEYHGYTNAGIKSLADKQKELAEDLITHTEVLPQIVQAVGTILERGKS